MDAETIQQPDREVVEEDVEKAPETTAISAPVILSADESTSFVQNIKAEPQDCETNMSSDKIGTPMAIEPQENNEMEENVPTNVVNNETIMPTVFEAQESNDVTENVQVNVVSNESELPVGAEPQESTDILVNVPTNVETPTEVRVKEEPRNDEIPIDSDVPIAKDSSYLSDNVFATPLPTSDFLDGIATAIAPVRTPRLRVKTEFSLRQPISPQKTALEGSVVSWEQTDQLNNDNFNEETPPPPPPPSLSSNSSSELFADGIATPRISLLALNRLKVKTELSQPDYNEDNSSLPAEFFNDLLKPNSPKEAGEVSESNSETDSEGIPADFFDDLLPEQSNDIDKDADNNEIEEKYSDRLREKEKLKNAYRDSMEKTKDKRRSHKKQKKSKKKHRKRSRSRSPIHNKERDRRNISPTSYSKEYKRSRRLSPIRHDTSASCSKDYYPDESKINDSLWKPESFIRVKQEFEVNAGNQTEQVITPIENVEEIAEILTPKQKRERALKRATALLNHLRNTSSSDNFITSTFQFASTVRKLPTSHSYVQQQIYENRSPLHTINNVSYKFNSHATRFNMEEWGLAALPTHAAKVAKRIGFDAQFIYEKLKTIKIPAKLKKVKQEDLDLGNEEEEDLVEGTSSLFCNAMTQTDDDNQYNTLHKGKGYDIGVQAKPTVYSIGSQTLETQSPTDNLHKDDEVPIMNIIRDLNEHQLMAMHSFAELIKKPNPNTSAMDMYKIQMKIMDIYKISQIPSALTAPETQITNNYTTTYDSPSRRREQPIIQSVKSADGTQFSINDPRAKSVAYDGRIINNYDDVGSGTSLQNFDSRLSRGENRIVHFPYNRPPANDRRYNHNTHPTQSYSSYREHQQSHQPPMETTTTKRYGRGALRR